MFIGRNRQKTQLSWKAWIRAHNQWPSLSHGAALCALQHKISRYWRISKSWGDKVVILLNFTKDLHGRHETYFQVFSHLLCKSFSKAQLSMNTNKYALTFFFLKQDGLAVIGVMFELSSSGSCFHEYYSNKKTPLLS